MRLRFRIGEKHPNGSYVWGDNADAHPESDDPLYGTICFRTVEDSTNLRLVVHELAHMQIPGKYRGHDEEWWYNYVGMLRGIDPEEYLREKQMYPDRRLPRRRL